MQYQVLARKWRPQNFHEIVGQEHVSRTLLNALESNRIAHAFLFSGPRGSGKTSTARILAKALNCHNGKPGEPCGDCPACTEIAAGNCMDVLEIDAASNRGIDEIRELKEKVRYNPARDRYKIFIIDEVHMLTAEAFNALLKTLEEPPPHVVFILATTEYHKIPATILSRCQQFSFKLIQYPLIMKRLRQIAESENIEISDPALEQVVFSSGGSMRDAMSALDQVIAFSGNSIRDEDVTTLLGLIEPHVLAQTVRAIAKNDSAEILRVVAELVESGQDLNNFCRRLSGQFRNLMIVKAGIADSALLGIPESLLPSMRELADLFSREDLLRLFDAFQKIETGMKYATQLRFQLEMGLLELAHIAKLRSLEELIAEFGRMPEGEVAKKYGSDATSDASNPPPSKRRSGSQKLPENPVSTSVTEKPAPSEIPHTGSSGLPTAKSDVSKPPVQDSRDFLLKIAAAVGREALESLLQTLEGARLQGDSVLLELGTTNDFIRHQIEGNLPYIAQAAAKIVGRKVTVLLVEPTSNQTRHAAGSREAENETSEADLLERAKHEPIIKSFLDVFPGPVKAEKIDE
jgi:DNA polymerase-3 subunit gamma/tau